MKKERSYFLTIETKGEGDFINVTSQINNLVKKIKVAEGILFLFLKSTTAGLAILEDEEGHLRDLRILLNKIVPRKANYYHNQKWQDQNAHSHLMASFFSKELVILFSEGKLNLGNWQNVFLLEFDNKPRKREIIIKVLES